MPRFTTAYSSLSTRLDEVSVLRKLAAAKERVSPLKSGREVNALCRGAIVLLSGHLEAYVKELGELALDTLYAKKVVRTNLDSRIFYQISKRFVGELKETQDPEKIADKVFSFVSQESLFWSRTGAFPSAIPVAEFNKGFGNPKYDKIRAYFNRFGYESYDSDLKRELKSSYQMLTNSIDHLVDIRNRIAHGELASSKTPAEVKAMAGDTQFFCRVTDKLFANWCGSHLCGIR